MIFIKVLIIILFFSAIHVISSDSESEFDKKFRDIFKNKPIDYENDYESDDYEEESNSDLINKTVSDLKSGSNRNISEFAQKISEYDQISNLYNNVTQNIRPIEDRIKLKFHEFIDSLELPVDCLASFASILNAMKKGEMWAFKFMDSTGKIPPGVTEGVSSFFGDYDQCLNIESSQSEIDNNSFQGKYCLASPQLAFPSFQELHNNITLKFLNNKTNSLLNNLLKRKINTIKLLMANNFYISKFTFFRIGICIPSNCDAKDIQNAINKVLQPILKIPIEVGPECNVRNNKTDLNQFQSFSKIVFIFLLIMVIISTTLDLFISTKTLQKTNKNLNKKSRKIHDIFLIFSTIKSTKSLFMTKKVDYQCIHTITFIFIIWIHMGRYYIAPLTINLIGVKKIFSSFILQLISDKKYFWVRTPFPFGTLFLLSGVYIALDFFGKKQKISPASYVNFAIVKWVRYNIRCIGPILVIFIISAIGEGPVWHLGEKIFAKSCENNYWQNLLFINTYMGGMRNICNPSSVYISIIFQLQIISPLIMIPLYYSPKIGIIINVIAIILGCIGSILPQFLGLPIAPFEVSDMDSVDQIQRSLVRYNVGPEQCITPFITGILTGYLIINRYKFLNKTFISIIFWISFITLSSSAIIWGENFKDLDIIPNKLNLLLWFSLGKILWASGCGCLILVLCIGKGIIYRFLSMDMFRPITRLNFTFLLLHTLLMYYRLFITRDNVELTHSYMFQCIFVDTFLTYVMAYLLYVLIEYPFNCLIQFFMSPNHSSDENSNDINFRELKPLNNKPDGSNGIEIKFSFNDCL